MPTRRNFLRTATTGLAGIVLGASPLPLTGKIAGKIARADYRPQIIVDLARPRFVRDGSEIRDLWEEELEQAVRETASAKGETFHYDIAFNKKQMTFSGYECTKHEVIRVEKPSFSDHIRGGYELLDGKCIAGHEITIDIPYEDIYDVRRGEGWFDSDNVHFETKGGESYDIDFREEAQATQFATSLARVSYIAQRMAQDTKHNPLREERDKKKRLDFITECTHNAFDQYLKGGKTKLYAMNVIGTCIIQKYDKKVIKMRLKLNIGVFDDTMRFGREELEIVDYLTRPGQYQSITKDNAFRDLVHETAKVLSGR